MNYRFLGAWALGCILGWLPAEPIRAQSLAGDGVRFQPASLLADQNELETVIDQGEITWASDDGDSTPSAASKKRSKPSPFQLVQATEPAAGPGAQNRQTPSRTNANETGALDDTTVDGVQSNVAAASDAAGDVDAAALRAQHDAATLLRDVPGVTVDAHAPNIHETSLRGRRLGQLPAKGSYWFPARLDLDTMLSKIDSTMVENIVVYRGPYSTLYGPGLAFYDLELLRAPQYDVGSGFQSHSTSLLQYETNGEQWNGRQAFWGGDETWGFRGGYSHRGGSDYETGNGTELPSSYKSRQADVALGGWLTPDSRIDVQYIRLDQTDVEFPGQFFDINALVTDAVEATYEVQNQPMFDVFTADLWYNRTDFYGDNLRPGKRRILPLDQIVFEIPDPNPQNPGGTLRGTRSFNSFTDVASYSTGFRAAMGWGDRDGDFLIAGADMRYLSQRIDENNQTAFTTQEFDAGGNPFSPPMTDVVRDVENPLPKAHSANPGLFSEWSRPLSEQVSMRAGSRIDAVGTDAATFNDGVNLEEALGGPFDQNFNLGAAFFTLDYQATESITYNTGVGFAMRPPVMTELYAVGPFIAVLPQYVFTSVFGDPLLDSEQMLQADIGVSADYGDVRGGVQGYHAWVEDYITLDFLDTGFSSAYAYVNTPLATLIGCEAYGECDLTSMLSAFSTLSYVEGRDLSRTSTISRQRQVIQPGAQSDQRSQPLFAPPGPPPTNDHEPLPVMAPLVGRIGCRLHEASRNPFWNVEFVANVVDNQDLVATSLREFTTPGYTTYDVYSFWKLTDNSTVMAGVRNLTDKFYQTYFDTRQAGLVPVTQVFQPGISFVFGWEYSH